MCPTADFISSQAVADRLQVLQEWGVSSRSKSQFRLPRSTSSHAGLNLHFRADLVFSNVLIKARKKGERERQWRVRIFFCSWAILIMTRSKYKTALCGSFEFQALFKHFVKKGRTFSRYSSPWIYEYCCTSCYNKTKWWNDVLIIWLFLIDMDERIPLWCSTMAWEDLTWFHVCKLVKPAAKPSSRSC